MTRSKPIESPDNSIMMLPNEMDVSTAKAVFKKNTFMDRLNPIKGFSFNKHLRQSQLNQTQKNLQTKEALTALIDDQQPFSFRGQQSTMSFADWIEKYFYDPTTVNMFGRDWDFSNAETLKLQPVQRRIIDATLTRNKNGDFPYSTIVYSTIKKEGKTTLTGAVGACYSSIIEPPNLTLCLANDQEQSAGRIFGAMLPTFYKLGCRVPLAQSSKPEIRLPNGTIIQAIANNYAGNAGANYGLTLWCLDTETEVLTNNGWRRYDTIEVDDLIATRSPEGNLEYEPANDVFMQKYNGVMHRCKGKQTDFLVTPGHRVIGQFKKTNSRYADDWRESELEIFEAKDACKFSDMKFPTISEWNGVEHHTVQLNGDKDEPAFIIENADAWFEFLGWYISEGNSGFWETSKGRKYGCNISQSKFIHPENYQQIYQCLLNLGLTEDQIHCNNSGFAIKQKQIGYFCWQLGKSHEKYIPREMMFACKRQLLLLFHSYLKGDGSCFKENEFYSTCTVSKQLSDDLFDLAQKCGYNSKIQSIRKASNNKCNDLYRMSFTVRIPTVYHYNWTEENYNGIVWCPSTNNGVIYIRRNGQALWTHNSELWAYTSERSRRLYDELVPVPTRKNSLRWIETYAGFEDESDLLLHLFNRIFSDTLESATQPKARPVPGLEDIQTDGRPACWHIPEEGLFVYWNHTPRMPWNLGEIGDKFRAAQKADLRPSQYVRLWENRWQSSEGNFIEPEWYNDACVLDGPEETPMFLAGDASQNNDTTVLVGVKKYQIKIFNEIQERYKLVYCSIWDPKRLAQDSEQIKYGAKKYEINLEETIGAEIKRLYDLGLMIGPFRYDKYQMNTVAVNLRKKKVPCVEFSQQQERMRADTFFAKLLKKGLLDLYYHPVLKRHIKNAKAKELDNEQLRIVKGVGNRGNKVDGAVALSMACYVASQFRPEVIKKSSSSIKRMK